MSSTFEIESLATSLTCRTRSRSNRRLDSVSKVPGRELIGVTVLFKATCCDHQDPGNGPNCVFFGSVLNTEIGFGLPPRYSAHNSSEESLYGIAQPQ